MVSLSSKTVSFRSHAHRVRILYLYLDVMARYLLVLPKPFNPPRRHNKLMTAILKRFTTPSPPVEPHIHTDKYTESSEIIGSMSNLKELILARRRSFFYTGRLRGLESFFEAVMSHGSIRSVLCCLTLSISLECYGDGFTSVLVLPRLRELNITLSEDRFTYNRDSVAHLRNTVIPFINNHHDTLESLKLTLVECSSFGTPCLLGLCHFPRLRTFEFYHYPITAISLDHILDTSGLRHILEIHSSGLGALGLDVLFSGSLTDSRLASERYAREIFQVALPYLKSLKLGTGFFWDWQRTSAYLPRFGQSLTTLTLSESDIRFSYSDAKAVADAFSDQGHLQSLDMSVHFLSPDLIDLLAATLPGLHILELGFGSVCRSAIPTEANEGLLVSMYPGYIQSIVDRDLPGRKFCQAMQNRLYPEWKLQRFIGHKLPGPYMNREALANCKAALAVALPGLQMLEILQGKMNLCSVSTPPM